MASRKCRRQFFLDKREKSAHLAAKCDEAFANKLCNCVNSRGRRSATNLGEIFISEFAAEWSLIMPGKRTLANCFMQRGVYGIVCNFVRGKTRSQHPPEKYLMQY